jgi:hypothetical protein
MAPGIMNMAPMVITDKQAWLRRYPHIFTTVLTHVYDGTRTFEKMRTAGFQSIHQPDVAKTADDQKAPEHQTIRRPAPARSNALGSGGKSVRKNYAFAGRKQSSIRFPKPTRRYVWYFVPNMFQGYPFTGAKAPSGIPDQSKREYRNGILQW